MVLAHKDTGHDQFVSTVEHRANIVFEVDPLASGYSKDVHGQVG